MPWATALVAGAVLAAPLAAQDRDPELGPLPPQIESPKEDKDLYAQLTFSVYPQYRSIHDEDALLRPALVKGKATDWLVEGSPLVEAFQRDGASRLGTSGSLQIDAGGRVTGCEFRESSRLPMSLDAFCDWLGEAARFAPAIAQDGTAVAGEARISIWAGRRSVDKGAPAPSFFATTLQIAPPAPPPPPRPLRLTKFPPDRDWLTFHTRPFTGQVGPIEWFDSVRDDVQRVGLFYGDKKSLRRGCQVYESSGDEKTDLKACRWVERTLKPRWANSIGERHRHAVMIVQIDGDDFSYIAPDRKAYRRVEVDGARRRALLERLIAETGAVPRAGPGNLSVHLSVGADGRATNCRIRLSSGSDAGDIAACNILREEDWFIPLKDIFGRPIGRGFYTWTASNEQFALERRRSE